MKSLQSATKTGGENRRIRILRFFSCQNRETLKWEPGQPAAALAKTEKYEYNILSFLKAG